MNDRKGGSAKSKSPGQDLRQAKVTTKTAKQMTRLLEGREIELVGRGPHQVMDGTFVAHIVATEQVIANLPKNIGTIEIQPLRTIPAAEAAIGTGNRYAKEGSVPHGVGKKE